MRRALAASFIAVVAATAACGGHVMKARSAPSTQSASGSCGFATTAPAIYDHVVWIAMENNSYSGVMRSSSARYIRSLAKACGLATNFHAEGHPSLPNYLAMTSGSTHAVHDDADPASHRIGGPSIFSQLGGGWRALEESMPNACRRTDSGLYAVRHNPAAYYTKLGRSCRRQDVRLGKRVDLSARFTFITPNLCHDSHSCSVGAGDRYIAGLVPRILRSPEYRAGRMGIFITWDEDDGSSGNHIPTLVISPHTRPGTRSALRFDHYSLLRTTDEMLGLSAKPGAAAHARSMRAAFGL